VDRPAAIDARPMDVVGQVALGAFRDVRSNAPFESLVRDLQRLKDAEPAGDPSSAEDLLEYYAYTAEHLTVDDLLSLPERLVAQEESMTVAQVLMQRGRAEGEAHGRAEGEAHGRAEGEAHGRAEGEAHGRAEGARRVLANLLALRFGPLDAEVTRRLGAASETELLRAAERVLVATSAADVFLEA
jgi:flagellar biosynthesis/type III secretory pathway protein FliH